MNVYLDSFQCKRYTFMGNSKIDTNFTNQNTINIVLQDVKYDNSIYHFVLSLK